MARLAARAGTPAPPTPTRIPARVNPTHPIQARVNTPPHPLAAAQVPNPIQARASSPAPAPAAPMSSSMGGSFSPDMGAAGAADFSSLLDPIAEAPVIPNASQDATYLAQWKAYQQALDDQKAQDQLVRGQYNTNYLDTLNSMGWRGDPTSGGFDPNDRSGYYGQAYGNTQEDFAGRGMLESGSFIDALAQLSQDYGTRKTGIDTARNQYLAGQDQQLLNYTNQNQSAQNNALMEAIARIAQQYAIDPSQVPR